QDVEQEPGVAADVERPRAGSGAPDRPAAEAVVEGHRPALAAEVPLSRLGRAAALDGPLLVISLAEEARGVVPAGVHEVAAATTTDAFAADLVQQRSPGPTVTVRTRFDRLDRRSRGGGVGHETSWSLAASVEAKASAKMRSTSRPARTRRP